jgi:hypothetical protein
MPSTDRPPGPPRFPRPALAALLVLGLPLLGAGCGGAGDPGPTGAASTGPPPAALPPPPATVAGPRGTVTMAPFGGCWRDAPGGPAVCGDPVWPTCPDPALPTVPADPGDTLTFTVRTPRPARLTLLEGDGSRTVTLPEGSRSARWTVTGPPGPLVLRAEVPGRGDPAWAACLVTRR